MFLLLRCFMDFVFLIFEVVSTDFPTRIIFSKQKSSSSWNTMVNFRLLTDSCGIQYIPNVDIRCYGNRGFYQLSILIECYQRYLVHLRRCITWESAIMKCKTIFSNFRFSTLSRRIQLNYLSTFRDQVRVIGVRINL